MQILVQDDPPVEIFTLRKKLLRYTKSLTNNDKDKYDNDIHYIELAEEKA